MKCELPDIQARFRKGRGARDQIANIRWIIEKAKEFQKTTSTSALLTTPKDFDYVDHNRLWKIIQEIGISDHLTCLLRNLYAGQEATAITRNGTTEWCKSENEYIKTVYCHPAYLTYMQSTSCGKPSWRNHKLESRSLGEISMTSDTLMTPPLRQEVKKN